MTNFLYVQVFYIALVFFLVWWATNLSPPWSDMVLTAALLASGLSLVGLLQQSVSLPVSNIILGNAQILYWGGIILGADAVFGEFIKLGSLPLGGKK